MLIWSRLGFLGVVIPAVLVLIAREIVPVADQHDPRSIERAKATAIAFGTLTAAAVLLLLGRWLNTTETIMLVEPKSGTPVELQVGGGHTLFFIPLQYWSFLWITFGVYFYLTHYR